MKIRFFSTSFILFGNYIRLLPSNRQMRGNCIQMQFFIIFTIDLNRPPFLHSKILHMKRLTFPFCCLCFLCDAILSRQQNLKVSNEMLTATYWERLFFLYTTLCIFISQFKSNYCFSCKISFTKCRFVVYYE